MYILGFKKKKLEEDISFLKKSSVIIETAEDANLAFPSSIYAGTYNYLDLFDNVTEPCFLRLHNIITTDDKNIFGNKLMTYDHGFHILQLPTQINNDRTYAGNITMDMAPTAFYYSTDDNKWVFSCESVKYLTAEMFNGPWTPTNGKPIGNIKIDYIYRKDFYAIFKHEYHKMMIIFLKNGECFILYYDTNQSSDNYLSDVRGYTIYNDYGKTSDLLLFSDLISFKTKTVNVDTVSAGPFVDGKKYNQGLRIKFNAGE